MGDKQKFKVAGIDSYGDIFKQEDDGSLIDIDLLLGMYRVVELPADRLAIPTGKRRDGMKVYETNTGITNQLVNGVTDTDWIPNIIKQTFVNSGAGLKFTVADITKYKSVKLHYSMTRGVLEEMGIIVMTSSLGKPLSRQFDFDFCGINMVKQITGDDLELVWNDTFSDGDDTEFFTFIERITL